MRNAGYSVADQLLQPILWLVASPLFVARLGIDGYGVWMLATTLLGFSGVMAFGMGDATVKFVAKYRALNDEEGVARVIRSTATLYIGLGVVAGVICFLLAPSLAGKGGVFRVDSARTELAVLAIRIAGVGIAARFLDSAFQAAIQGFERYDLAARVSMVANTATLTGNVIVVWLGYGLRAILCSTVVILIMSAVVKALVLRRMLVPRLRLLPLLHKAALVEVFRFGMFSWMQGIGSLLFSQVDRLLVASLVGTTALGYYSLCLQLAQQIHSVLARAVAFVFPLASAAKERGDTGRLRRVYFNGAVFTTVAATAISFPVFMLAHNILVLWMGQNFAAVATEPLRVLVFVSALLATSIVPHYYMNGTGYVGLNTAFAVVSGAIVTSVAFVLIPPLGIVGAAWARIATTPAGVISRTVLHYSVLQDRRWYAGVAIVLPIVITFGFGMLWLAWFGERLLGIGGVIGLGVLYGLLALGLATLVSRFLITAPTPTLVA